MLAKRDKTTQVVLGLIGSSSTLVFATIPVRVLQMVGVSKGGRRWSQRKYYVNTVITRLLDQGLVELLINNRGIKCSRLTEKGRNVLRRYQLNDLKIKRPRQWDGKYHAVIFDIKEWKRGLRNEIRSWLEHLGFVRLQNSVWVYPYECQEVVALLKSHFKIGKEVLYLTVETIENDRWLKKEFNLI